MPSCVSVCLCAELYMCMCLYAELCVVSPSLFGDTLIYELYLVMFLKLTCDGLSVPSDFPWYTIVYVITKDNSFQGQFPHNDSVQCFYTLS